MSWIQQRTHRALRHFKTGGAELVQQKADERHENLRARLDKQLELHVRRLNNQRLIYNGRKQP